MENFNDLKDTIAADMDTSKMHCSYDYAFAADVVTLTFHKPGNEAAVIKTLRFENASERMKDIVNDTRTFLRSGIRRAARTRFEADNVLSWAHDDDADAADVAEIDALVMRCAICKTVADAGAYCAKCGGRLQFDKI